MSTRSEPRDTTEVHGALPPRLVPLVEPLTEAAAYACEAWSTSDASFEKKPDGSRVTAGDVGHVAHVNGSRPDRAIMALPARRELYLAERGEGAWRMDEEGRRAVRLRLSEEAEPVARLPLAASDPERRRLAGALDLEPGEFQRAMGPMIATLFWGASRLAVGRRNVLYDWDLAAPELVAVEAGGSVTDLDGRTLRYGDPDPGHPGGVLATAPGVDHGRGSDGKPLLIRSSPSGVSPGSRAAFRGLIAGRSASVMLNT